MASLWPNEGNKTIWGNIQAKKNIFFQKNTLCHSFRISVIPSVVLTFLLDYCHSFHISVIPSELMSFLPNYCHFKYFSSWIAPVPSHSQRARKMATGGGHICECILILVRIVVLQITSKVRALLNRLLKYYLMILLTYKYFFSVLFSTIFVR